MRAIFLAAALLLAATAGADTTVSAGAAMANISNTHGVAPAIEVAHDIPAGHGAWRLNAAWIGSQDVDPDEWNGRTGTIDDFWTAGAQGVYFQQAGQARLEAGVGFSYRTEAFNAHYLLPSRLNFSLTLGARYGRTSIQLRHLSNGWTRDSNRGQNWLQVGWAF